MPPFCPGTAERFPGMTLPCPASSCGDVGGHCDTPWWSPQRSVCVVLCPCSLHRFSAVVREAAWHPAVMHKVQGKGDRTGKCWGTDWPSAWMDQGLGSQLTVLLGDVSRAIDKGVVGVAHLGFKRYISLYSSDSYPAILIIDQSTILKTPKHLPPEKSLCSPQRHWELFW